MKNTQKQMKEERSKKDGEKIVVTEVFNRAQGGLVM